MLSDSPFTSDCHYLISSDSHLDYYHLNEYGFTDTTYIIRLLPFSLSPLISPVTIQIIKSPTEPLTVIMSVKGTHHSDHWPSPLITTGGFSNQQTFTTQ